MNAFKLALLFIAIVLVLNACPQKSAVATQSVTLRDKTAISVSGRLHVPSIIKWDAALVDAEREGVVELRVDEMRFIYVRSADVPRNEYILQSRALSEISVDRGDLIEIDFSRSNIDGKRAINTIIITGGDDV